MDERTKRDIQQIGMLVTKCDFRNKETVNKIGKIAKEKQVLSSPIGIKFLKRIYALGMGNESDTGCIICKAATTNGVLCALCQNKIISIDKTPSVNSNPVVNVEKKQEPTIITNKAVEQQKISAKKKPLWLWCLLGFLVLALIGGAMEMLEGGSDNGLAPTQTSIESNNAQETVADADEKKVADSYVKNYCSLLTTTIEALEEVSECEVTYGYEDIGDKTPDGYTRIRYWIKLGDESVAIYAVYFKDSEPALVVISTRVKEWLVPAMFVPFPKSVVTELSDSEAIDIFGRCNENWGKDMARGDGKTTSYHYQGYDYTITNDGEIYLYSIESK